SRWSLTWLVLALTVVGAGPAVAAEPACPSSNPPNTMALAGGAPQTAKLGTPFASNLEVTLANTNGCAVTTGAAGVAVTFTAPVSGATGTFSASGSDSLTVGANAAGLAAAQFAANALAGTFTASAAAAGVVQPVVFSLDNLAGKPPTLAAVVRTARTATVGSRFTAPLEVEVRDANGKPLQGASVSFSLGGGANG